MRTAHDFRRYAETFRRLAQQAVDTKEREKLLGIAVQFDRLAKYEAVKEIQARGAGIPVSPSLLDTDHGAKKSKRKLKGITD